MTVIRRPLALCNLWIEGTPKSFQGGKRDRYTARIQAAALQAMARPTRSPRIDINIFFADIPSLRADVDNVIKPILDTLKGIVYIDDNQVRSVRVVAFNKEDAYHIIGPFDLDVLGRLSNESSREFLITVYEGITIDGL